MFGPTSSCETHKRYMTRSSGVVGWWSYLGTYNHKNKGDHADYEPLTKWSTQRLKWTLILSYFSSFKQTMLPKSFYSAGRPHYFCRETRRQYFLNTLSIRFPNCEVQTLIETKTGGKRQKPPHYLTGSKMIADLNYMRDPPQNMSICGGEIPLWTNCSHHSARLWGVVDSDGLRSLDLLLLEDRSILRLSQLPTVKGW